MRIKICADVCVIVIRYLQLSCGIINIELAMPRRKMNGGPGRAWIFDLPIMRPARRVLRPAPTPMCRHFKYISLPFPLPLRCSMPAYAHGLQWRWWIELWYRYQTSPVRWIQRLTDEGVTMLGFVNNLVKLFSSIWYGVKSDEEFRISLF